MSDIEKLKSVFHGVSDTGERVNCPFGIEASISTPPPYIVKLALVVVGGFNWYPSADKVTWEIFVTYKGTTYKFHDWKYWGWSIAADKCTPAAKVAGVELKQKVIQVSMGLDKLLEESLQPLVLQGQFFLNNTYPKIAYTYRYFRDKATSLAKEPLPPRIPDQTKDAKAKGLPIRSLNRWAKRSSKYYQHETERVLNAFAMIGFYYSALDILLSIFFAFGERKVEFAPFRNLSWRERFLAVLPVGTDSELARIYKGLLRLKRDIRDEIFHGLGGEESVLVPLEGFGAVPLSYEPFTRSVHYSILLMDVPLIDEAVHTFDKFDSWIRNNPPWSCGLEYARSGLAIPFYGESLDEVKQAMQAPKTFARWLKDKIEYEDFIANQ